MRFAILLSAISLISCAHGPPPPNVKKCQIVSIDGLPAVYLHCLDLYNTGYEEKIDIKKANKYVCTDPDGYDEAEKYKIDLETWIKNHCKE